MFKNQDKDGDGKLTGDEIPQFLKARIDSIDTDKDGSITLEEIQKGMGGRGGRGNRN
jgi:Ca2+-binding EF-hand superfamily protein